MQIAVIGGGAAGMMCAANLAKHSDHDIILFEKNQKLGAKVIISGGGRCNLTTGYYRSNEVLSHYTRGKHLAKQVFKTMGPKKVRQRFEDHGVQTKEESDKRIFPLSNDGHEVVSMFERLMHTHGVQVRMGEGVQKIRKLHDSYEIITSQGVYSADCLVIATGGNAYRQTGSTGDGYAFARDLSHTVTDLGPSLNSFITDDKHLHELSGIALDHASLHRNGHGHHGPVLLTHFGISGPGAFVLASHTAFETISPAHPLQAYLQCFSDRDFHWREEYLLTQIDSSPRKTLHTILSQLLPKRLATDIISRSRADGSQKISTLTRQQRTSVTKLLGEGIPLTIIGRRPGDEFVTAGGVSTDEIDHKTLESAIVPGLYFAGEVLNVDGVTGGYNLQRCRASGYTVASSLSQSEAE